MQLIEEIIFLAEIDDKPTSADGIEINDIDEDLIFGSVKDFEFDDEENSGNADPYVRAQSIINWRAGRQFGVYDILCVLDEIHASIQQVPKKSLM